LDFFSPRKERPTTKTRIDRVESSVGGTVSRGKKRQKLKNEARRFGGGGKTGHGEQGAGS